MKNILKPPFRQLPPWGGRVLLVFLSAATTQPTSRISSWKFEASLGALGDALCRCKNKMS